MEGDGDWPMVGREVRMMGVSVDGWGLRIKKGIRIQRGVLNGYIWYRKTISVCARVSIRSAMWMSAKGWRQILMVPLGARLRVTITVAIKHYSWRVT